MSFVHLNTHSVYSLLNGTASLGALVEQARRLGFKHLALTDRNALYGAVEFYKLARQAGIQPIIGADIDLDDGSRLALLVKNELGYRNLCRIISRGRLQGGHLQFKLGLKEILPFKEGLVILSGGQQGRLWKLVKQGRIEQALQYCRQMRTWFGSDFCVEMQIFHPSDQLLNLRQRDIAYRNGVPITATNAVYLLHREEWPLRKLLHAIDQKILFEQVSSAGSPEQYLKSAAEMRKLFKQFPEALENTLRIARQCRFEFRLGKPVFPRLDLPEGETAYSFLWKEAFKGAQERYRIVTRELMDRLSREVNTINELGFSDYFLIVKDIVDFCRREGIPCVGRGSAGDSLISYLLGITQVDPLRYHLYFERFLNPQRSDPPDIDLDLCWKSRDRVIEYVYQKYGQNRTAMICTFNTFQLRSSIRDTARAFGFPEEEIGAITKYLPHYGIDRLFQALEQAPECRYIRGNVEALEQALEYAQRIANFPRHLSIHPGGVIIAPDDLRNYTPLEVAGKGIVVSQYDMYSIEPLGLVKMDLLGVRSLSVISDCLADIRAMKPAGPGEASPRKTEVYRFDIDTRRIVKDSLAAYRAAQRFPFWDEEKRHLSPLDLRVIPENDPNVIALLRSGLSLGCFQTESPAMRGLLKKMRIDGMDDVIISVALIRPGAADSGMKDVYIARRAGLQPVEYPHPALEAVLAETYGGIVYQEQVMQVAAAIAGFSLAEADVLRRAMTKKRDAKILRESRQKFIRGARENGLDKKQAEQIWQFLSNFTGYGFNKAHSCTYGAIAYQTAYLKYYFPVPYMTAVLNNHGGFYSRAAYISECRRMGIGLLPPDINRSRREFSCAGDTIIAGLESVFELTRKTRERILAEQAKSPFCDYYDFMQRVQPREGEVKNLIKAGALRSLDPNEPLMLLRNKLYFKNRRNRSLTESLLHQVRLLPYNKHQRILNEIEMLGFALTDHPLALFESKIDWEAATPSYQLEAHKGKRVQFVGWLVAHRRVAARNREYMKFLTLEDRYGLCEAVLFSRVYKQYGHLTRSSGPFRITGTVQSRLPGEANLIVERLELIILSREELEGRLERKIKDKD